MHNLLFTGRSSDVFQSAASETLSGAFRFLLMQIKVSLILSQPLITVTGLIERTPAPVE